MASTSSSATAASNGAAQTDDATAAFASDPNMHFDTQTKRWLYENPESGQEFEWNIAANAWLPVMTDEEREAQQKAYSVAGVDESAPANVELARDRRKKRKAEGGQAESNKKPAKPKPAPRNTAIYVQNLPQDATIEEVSEVFSKAGLILPGADGSPKIKLYTDSTTGQRNGDGLIVYMNEDSVTLAINLLDDSPLRLGGSESMRVAKADWGHKAGQDGEQAEEKRTERKKKVSKEEAQRIQRRAEKARQQAQDYDPSYDEKDSALADIAKPVAQTALGGKVVVLSHVFILQELEEDASLLLDLKEDVREECESLGTVTNVVLYDKEPDGIVTIKFTDPVSAQACVIKNNNRFFGGRQLKAWIFDGKTRYKKSGGVSDEGENTEENEKKRLEEFAKWLEDEKE